MIKHINDDGNGIDNNLTAPQGLPMMVRLASFMMELGTTMMTRHYALLTTCLGYQQAGLDFIQAECYLKVSAWL